MYWANLFFVFVFVFLVKWPIFFLYCILFYTRSSSSREMATASFRWILQLHRDVSKAARFYAQGLDFSVNVVTLRWAELHSGPIKLALMQSPRFYLLFCSIIAQSTQPG